MAIASKQITLGFWLLPLLLLCGCKTNICPTEPNKDESSYYPYEIGKRWQYDYVRTETSIGGEITSVTQGILTWQVADVSASCEQIDIDILEQFEGVRVQSGCCSPPDTSSVTWTKPNEIRLEGKQLVYFWGYIEREYNAMWIHPRGAPDVIPASHGCGRFDAQCVSFGLGRGIGIMWWRSEPVQPYSGNTTEITLRQG